MFSRLSTARIEGSATKADPVVIKKLADISNAQPKKTAIVAVKPAATVEPTVARRARTMSQVRKVCPSDKELCKAIKFIVSADSELRFGMKITMATRSLIVQRLEEKFELKLKHKAGFIHKALERICRVGDRPTTAPSVAGRAAKRGRQGEGSEPQAKKQQLRMEEAVTAQQVAAATAATAEENTLAPAVTSEADPAAQDTAPAKEETAITQEEFAIVGAYMLKLAKKIHQKQLDKEAAQQPDAQEAEHQPAKAAEAAEAAEVAGAAQQSTEAATEEESTPTPADEDTEADSETCTSPFWQHWPSIEEYRARKAELNAMPRKELQMLAKKHGIKANLKTDAIISALIEKGA